MQWRESCILQRQIHVRFLFPLERKPLANPPLPHTATVVPHLKKQNRISLERRTLLLKQVETGKVSIELFERIKNAELFERVELIEKIDCRIESSRRMEMLMEREFLQTGKSRTTRTRFESRLIVTE